MVPHNWIQHWALLTWLAYKTGYEVGGMTWNFGDAHIYDEESHIQVANQIINNDLSERNHKINLVYTSTSDNFKASDFQIVGDIPALITNIRPTLL